MTTRLAEGTTIRIKGTKTGLVVILAEEPPLETLLADLTDRLKTGAGFFRDARVTLSVGNRSLTEEEWQRVRSLLISNGVVLQNVAVTAESSRQTAKSAGLTLISSMTSAQLVRQEARPISTIAESSEGLLIKRTLRSGQSIRHPGHVVILGDLHAGAEVIAGGDIVVWGALQGTAHAGALGDVTAGIYALHLAPTQLRINGYVARPPERDSRQSKPEAARIEGERIIVEAWGRGR